MIELANRRTLSFHERHRRAQKNYSKEIIKLNDLVLVRIPKQSSAVDNTISKFFHIYYGPYRVTRTFNANTYELAYLDNARRIVGRYNRADLRFYKRFPTGENT